MPLSIASLALLADAANLPVGMGRIHGGWSYVWASYGITWIALSLYALSLFLRRSEGYLPKDPP